MTVTPQGIVKLCQGVLENDYKNTLDFANLEEQSAYFESLVAKTYTDYYYMKKDGTITVGENIDNIINCNYLFYKNNGFTTKTYYCFITGMEYISENSTRITFVTDVYQTWLFDFSFKPSFIEREHVNDDTIGLHTVPENFETGEYIMIEDYTKTATPFQTLFYIMASTYDPFTKSDTGGNIYNGIFSGYDYFYFQNANDLSNFLREIDGAGKSDAVISIFMYPDELFEKSPYKTGSTYGYVTPGSSLKGYTLATITEPTSICEEKSYTPTNKKLLTFPFTYLQITNNAGTVNNISYEDIKNIKSGAAFDMVGIINSGGEIISYIEKAKNFQSNPYTNYTPLITNVAKLPVCTWNSDVYINWLTQNGINIAGDVLQIGSEVIKSMDNALSFTESGLSQGINSMYNIAGSVEKYYQHSLAPNTVKGQANNSNPLLKLGELEPRAFQMSIKKEYAKIIDNFFSMFGYKINLVKQPNLTGRQNWNYVKTIDANIIGNIPQNDIALLKSIFNNGVTIWHNPSNFLDYTKSNNIV